MASKNLKNSALDKLGTKSTKFGSKRSKSTTKSKSEPKSRPKSKSGPRTGPKSKLIFFIDVELNVKRYGGIWLAFHRA